MQKLTDANFDQIKKEILESLKKSPYGGHIYRKLKQAKTVEDFNLVFVIHSPWLSLYSNFDYYLSNTNELYFPDPANDDLAI